MIDQNINEFYCNLIYNTDVCTDILSYVVESTFIILVSTFYLQEKQDHNFNKECCITPY